MKTFYDHEDLLNNISKKTLSQIEFILRESDMPKNENSLKKIIECWLMKRAMFDKIVEHGNFTLAGKYDKNNRNACIAITLSGSILAVGPLSKGYRRITYISLNMRNDVPKTLTSENAIISEDVESGRILTFKEGPIKQTSEIIDIGIASDSENPDMQVRRIIEINKLLIDNFIQIDRNTFKSNYFDSGLNSRNDLFKKWIIIGRFVIGGLDRQVFLARAKLLWLELFTKLFQEISGNKNITGDKDGLFIEFTNGRFLKFLDGYKLCGSKNGDCDIGILKALEEIPGLMNYWDCQNEYLKEIGMKFR
jgi:hypothetical protein